MKKDEIEASVIAVISDIINTEELKLNRKTKLVEDLGVDSFMAIEIAYALKEEFNIDMSSMQWSDLKRIEDIIGLISKLSK